MYSIYEDLGLNYRRNNDYMLMPLMLWDMGIHANVEFMEYTRTCTYENREKVEAEMIRDLGELSYMNFNNQLEEKFLHTAEKKNDGYHYISRRVVQMIWYSN